MGRSKKDTRETILKAIYIFFSNCLIEASYFLNTLRSRERDSWIGDVFPTNEALLLISPRSASIKSFEKGILWYLFDRFDCHKNQICSTRKTLCSESP